MPVVVGLALGLLSGVVVCAIALVLSFPERDEVPIPIFPTVLYIGVNLLLAAPWGWKVVIPFDALILLMSLSVYVSYNRGRTRNDPSPPQDSKMTHMLRIGIAFYVIGALADGYMTLSGIGGNLALEGNPIVRWVMAQLGPQAGLVAQKTLVGALATLIAVHGSRAIKNREQWIEKVPSTPWGRDWMRRRDRSWIAFLPLYMVATAQALAAASWFALKTLY